MKVYIDTNIYVGCVNAASGLELLERIESMVKDGKFELVCTAQTQREYVKNVEQRDKWDGPLVISSIGLPPQIHNQNKKEKTEEEEKICSKIEKVNKEIEKMNIKASLEMTERREKIISVFERLFKSSRLESDSDDIIYKGVVRFAKGLPPQKTKPEFRFGDSIIWETLKNSLKDDLVIITKDGDFFQNTEKTEINKILQQEWEEATGKKVSGYSSLAEFINAVDNTNPVSEELINEEVQQNSLENFVYTVPVVSFINASINPGHTTSWTTATPAAISNSWEAVNFNKYQTSLTSDFQGLNISSTPIFINPVGIGTTENLYEGQLGATNVFINGIYNNPGITTVTGGGMPLNTSRVYEILSCKVCGKPINEFSVQTGVVGKRGICASCNLSQRGNSIFKGNS